MNPHPSRTPRPSTEGAYISAHAEAGALLGRIGELLSDLPAPGDEAPPIHWGHVGGLQEVVRRLTAGAALPRGPARQTETPPPPPPPPPGGPGPHTAAHPPRAPPATGQPSP